MKPHHVRRKSIGYTHVWEDVAQSLTFEQIGLLVHMLSKPPTWQFSSEQIAREKTAAAGKKVGVHEVRRVRAELEAKGYVRTVNARTARGTLCKQTWVRDHLSVEWDDGTECDENRIRFEPNAVDTERGETRVDSYYVPVPTTDTPPTTEPPLPVGKKAQSPEMVKAREIVTAWYDHSKAHTGADPTAQPFVAVMKVAAALLKVYPEKVVKQSLVDAAKAGTVSIGSCEIAIKRGGGVKAPAVRGPVVDRAELDRQADERQRADDELFAAGRPTFKPLGKVVL